MSDKQTEEERQQSTAEMNESAVGAMLEALSLSRTRRFCLMVEDECANLVRQENAAECNTKESRYEHTQQGLEKKINALQS